MQSAKAILSRHRFPGGPRNVSVISFISVLIEHQESLLLLVMHNKPGSAFALIRPVIEGAYRGLWLNLPASDEEVKRFFEEDKIELDFGKIATALDNAYGSGDFFQGVKNRIWKQLNSYTHGGMLQIGHRFALQEGVNNLEVAHNYSEEGIYELITPVTATVLILILNFLKSHGHQDSAGEVEALAEALVEGHSPVAERKKGK